MTYHKYNDIFKEIFSTLVCNLLKIRLIEGSSRHKLNSYILVITFYKQYL
jgi:hypothetical protein